MKIYRKGFRATRRWIKLTAIWLRGSMHHVALASNASVLVVCAHPDDETIFFSSVLSKERPYVLCMSNSGHKVRRKEFEHALKYWNVSGEMLNFPDVPGFAWMWRCFAARKLSKIRKSMPGVSTVYTHSGMGETNHAHHFAVHHGVKQAFSGCCIYTTAATVPSDGAGKLSSEQAKEKYQVMLDCYPSQVHILEKWCSWWEQYLHTEYFET